MKNCQTKRLRWEDREFLEAGLKDSFGSLDPLTEVEYDYYMSLPSCHLINSEMIKHETKKGFIVILSKFIRHVIRVYNTKKLARDIRQSEKEFAAGKGKVLNSFKDLR